MIMLHSEKGYTQLNQHEDNRSELSFTGRTCNFDIEVSYSNSSIAPAFKHPLFIYFFIPFSKVLRLFQHSH